MSDDRVVEVILHCQKKLKKEGVTDERLLHYLGRLSRLRITIDVLSQTGIGRTVNSLSRNEGKVGQAAETLVRGWKKMVEAQQKPRSESEEDEDTDSSSGAEEADSGSEPSLQNVKSEIKEEEPEINGSDELDEENLCIDDGFDNIMMVNGNGGGGGSSSDQDQLDHDEPTKNRDKYHESEEEPNLSLSNHDVEDDDFNDEIRFGSPSSSTSSTKRTHSNSQSNSSKHRSPSPSSLPPPPPPLEKKHEEKERKHHHHHNNHHHHDKEKDKEKSHHRRSHHSSSNGSSSNSSKRSKDKSDKERSSSEKEKDKHHHRSSHHHSHSSSSSSSRKKTSEHGSGGSSHSSSKSKSSNSTEVCGTTTTTSSSHSSSKKSKSDKHHRSSDKEKSKDNDHHRNSNGSSGSASGSSSSSSKHKSSSSSSSSKKLVIKEEIDSSAGFSFGDVLGSLDTKGTKNAAVLSVPVVSSKSSSSSKGSSSNSDKEREKRKAKDREESEKESKRSRNSSGSRKSIVNIIEPVSKPVPVFAGKTDFQVDYPVHSFPDNKQEDYGRSGGMMTDEGEDISTMLSSRSARSKVFSGVKTGRRGEVPTLYDMCMQVIKDNISELAYTGGIPYDILKPALERATPQQLMDIESYNEYLIGETDELWQFHCNRDFKRETPQEMESWRDLYERCKDGQRRKFDLITKQMKRKYEVKEPERKTKLAYVDTGTSGPRFNREKAQTIKNGMKTLKLKEEKGAKRGVSSSASVGFNNPKVSGDPTKVVVEEASVIIAPGSRAGHAPAPSVSREREPRAGAAAVIKPKKAPLMQKTMKLIRSLNRR